MTGESKGTSAHSPKYDAPSSMERILRSSASPRAAPHSTAFPPSKRSQKSSMSSPRKESGLTAYTVPSALPRMGVVNTSSVGMLGLKYLPPTVHFLPEMNCASGMRPTRRRVPLELRYSSDLRCRALTLSHFSRRARLCHIQSVSGSLPSARHTCRMSSHKCSTAVPARSSGNSFFAQPTEGTAATHHWWRLTMASLYCLVMAERATSARVSFSRSAPCIASGGDERILMVTGGSSARARSFSSSQAGTAASSLTSSKREASFSRAQLCHSTATSAAPAR